MQTSLPTEAPPSYVIVDFTGLLNAFGIQGAETPESRIVKQSEASSLGCPLHDVRLVPDLCGACRFLAGEGPRQ